MNQIPDSVLRWLYNSLKPEYHDVERTYADVAEALSRQRSLSPRTEVYTFENGRSALLLCMQGTIPVQFRGTTYRYPLLLWIPHQYPREPPIVYITPTRDMTIRPGHQHVSGEGKVYHPYLADWANRWSDFNIQGLLTVLVTAFSREPPVIASQRSHEQSFDKSAKPSTPSLSIHSGMGEGFERNLQRLPPNASLSQTMAPAPPPKKMSDSDNDTRNIQRLNGEGVHQPQRAPAPPPKGEFTSANAQAHTWTNGPPLPPLPRNFTHFDYDRGPFPDSPLAQVRRDIPYDNRYQQSPTPVPSEQPRDTTSHYKHYPPQQQPPQVIQQSSSTFRSQQFQSPQRPVFQNTSPFSQQHSQPQPIAVHQTQHKPAPPDLLSSPSNAIDPSNTTSPLAPPIPVNPEKDSLLSAISARLQALLASSITQNNSAIPALQSQAATMQHFQASLSAELSALQSLDTALSGNEQILRDAMREAESMEQGLTGREVPGVDEVLVAPTVVGEQLYQLVAEERGIGDAIFVLGRALERDRVSGEIFIKQTRSLAREQFLKKALIKKIADGMGLVRERVG